MDTNRALLKQYSFCKCLTAASRTGVLMNDSSDVSTGEIINLMDYNGMYTKKFRPILDSFTVRYIKENRRTYAVIDTQYTLRQPGTHALTYNCMQWYLSKQLDSLVRSFKAKDFMVDAADKQYR